MNKSDCKKYLKRTYKQIISHNKSITPENIEIEMKKVMEDQVLEYIAYSKIAVHNMQKSANEIITLKDLEEEINVLPKIYTKIAAIKKAENL